MFKFGNSSSKSYSIKILRRGENMKLSLFPVFLHTLPFFYVAIWEMPSVQTQIKDFLFVWLRAWVVYLSPRVDHDPDYRFQISNLKLDFSCCPRILHTKSNTWVKLMPIYSFCSHNHWAFGLNVLCSIKSVIKCNLLALFSLFLFLITVLYFCSPKTV